MRRVAFLTLSDPTGFVIDDDLAYEPLQKLGWQVETIPWNRPGVDWRQYAIVTHRDTGKTIAMFRCTQMVLYPKQDRAQ